MKRAVQVKWVPLVGHDDLEGSIRFYGRDPRHVDEVSRRRPIPAALDGRPVTWASGTRSGPFPIPGGQVVGRHPRRGLSRRHAACQGARGEDSGGRHV